MQAAERQAFDLDAVIGADLEEPSRPAPYYDLASIDRIIRWPDLLPPASSSSPSPRPERGQGVASESPSQSPINRLG